MASEKQLEWLRLAGKNLKNEKDKKKLLKNYDKFVKHHDQLDVLLNGIGYVGNTPRSKLEEMLREADASAEKGDFKNACKMLVTAKKLATTYLKGFPESEVGLSIRPKLERIKNSFWERAALVDQLEATVRNTMDELAGFPKMSEATTFEEACNLANAIAQREPELRARFFELHASQSVLEQLDKINIEQLNDQKFSIEAFKLAGKGELVVNEDALAEELEVIHNQYADRFGSYRYNKLVAQVTLEFELALRDLKDMSWAQALYEQENIDGDAQSKKAVSELTQSTDQDRRDLLEKEQRALEWAKQEFLLQQDKFNTQTERDQVTPAIELDPIFALDVFGTLLEPDEIQASANGDYVDLSENRIKEISQTASEGLFTYLEDLDVSEDQFFQLMTWQGPEFAEYIRHEIFSGSNNTNTNALSKKLGEALNEIVHSFCPNQMSEDGENLTVGGVEYVLDQVLKAGGNGEASRFRDPNTGKTIVVKTPSKRTSSKEVAHELLCHRRLMNNIDPDAIEASGLVGLEGVARGPDGTVHIILEDVQGGDLEDISNTMSVMSDAGILPPMARQVLMCDVIYNTAQAMREMEAAGLVHGDMKGENVMVTAEGRIKIIDFGESGFVQEGGGGVDARGLTPGYASPDIHLDEGMDARADTFALGGMIQKLVLSDSPTDGRTYSQGSLGKLIAGLKEPERENRPSLEAVMFNVLLASGAQDYDPTDVEALKAATAEVSAMASSAKASITDEEIADNLPYFGSRIEAGTVSLRKLKDFAKALEGKIVQLRNQVQGDEEAYLTQAKPQISIFEKEIAFLNNKVKEAFVIKTANAAQAFETIVADTQIMAHLVLPGQTSDVPLSRVVETRKQVAEKLEEAQHLFEQALLPLDDPNLEEAKAQAARIQKGEANLSLMDDAIYAAVGPEPKFFISLEKLKCAAKAFIH